MAVKIQYGEYVSGHGRLGNANLSRVYGASKSVGQYTSGSKFMTLAAFTNAVHIPYHDCCFAPVAMSKIDRRGARCQISLLATVR
jgi:hypothetical protein